MRQVRVHGPGDVRVDDVARPIPAPATPSSGWRPAASAAATSPTSGWADWPGRPEPRCASATRSPARSTGSGREVTRSAVGDRVVVQPGDDDPGRIGNGAAQGGLTPLLLVTDVDRGPASHRPRRPAPRHRRRSPSRWRSGCGPPTRPTSARATGVAVFGCGPIGLAAIATLVDRGHREGRGHRPQPRPTRAGPGHRRSGGPRPVHHRRVGRAGPTARDHALRVRPDTGHAAFIEASGSAQVITDVLDHGPVGGRLSVVALHYEPIPTSYLMLLMKQFTIRGSMEYPTALRGRHRPARPPRPVGADHPPCSARAVRRRASPAAGLEGLRQSAGQHRPHGNMRATRVRHEPVMSDEVST